MSSSSPIKVAVLGFGMSAQATATQSQARDKFGDRVQIVNKLEQVLADDEIDLVFVSTINDTHYEYSKAILNAGKHVVCEKPLTPTSEQAHELARLAKSKNLVLAVYQNRRWDSDFLTLKKLIAENKFGELSEFQSNFDRYKNEAATTKLWKEKDLPGSGSAYDLGSHLIDQILSLFGKPTSVTGIVRNSRLIGNPDVPDSFLIHLHYPSEPSTPGRSLPLLATARGSILSLQAPQLRFTVKGTEGAFIKYGLDTQEDQLKAQAENAVRKDGFGVEPKELKGTLWSSKGKEEIESEKGNYQAWFENVAEAVQSGDREKLIVTPEAAALTIEIIEVATRSSKEGRTIAL